MKDLSNNCLRPLQLPLGTDASKCACSQAKSGLLRRLAVVIVLPCALPAQNSSLGGDTGCAWSRIREHGEGIGGDRHASYYLLRLIPSPGDRLEVDAAFPHARYFSWTLYGEDRKLIGSFHDRQIQPVGGRNPFRQGVRRDEPEIGRYRLTFHFQSGPTRAANTLNVPGADGTRKFAMFYRVFDVDRRYRSGPQATSGGVPAPVLRLYGAAGKPYCPEPLTPDEETPPPARRPPADIESPPVWRHTGSTTTDDFPFANEGVVYVSAYLSGRHGTLAILRWRPPKTPVETFEGRPFPPGEEVRFWSLIFSGPPRVYLADREIPRLGMAHVSWWSG